MRLILGTMPCQSGEESQEWADILHQLTGIELESVRKRKRHVSPKSLTS
jgi:hypothetical protein